MEYSREIIIDCLNKLDGISDTSWEDILDKHSLEISDSHLRKISYGFKSYRNAFSDGSVDEFDEKILKINKEKIKLRDLRTETNRSLRSLARIENIVDLVKDELNYISEEKPMINEFHIKETSSGKDGILCLSDLHIGAVTNNSVNEYNLDICKYRINKIIDKTISHGLENDIDKLHIILNGDIISGELHSGIKLSNAEELTRQIVIASEMVSECIHKLSQHFYCTVQQNNGNHEAVELLKDDRSNKNNYSMLLNEFIRIRLKDLSNVMFMESINNGEMSLCDIKGLTVVSTHGDQITLNKCAEQLTMSVGERPDIIILGHYHKPMMMSQFDTEIYVNGSLVSTDDYAFKHKLYNPASQTMLIVSEEGVECSYVMKVQ